MFLFCCLVYFLLMLHWDLQSFFNQLPIAWTKNNWKGTPHAHAEYAKLRHPACWKSSHIDPAFPQKCSVPPSMRSMRFKTYRFNFAVPICVRAPQQHTVQGLFGVRKGNGSSKATWSTSCSWIAGVLLQPCCKRAHWNRKYLQEHSSHLGVQREGKPVLRTGKTHV